MLLSASCQHGKHGIDCIECYRLAYADLQSENTKLRADVESAQSAHDRTCKVAASLEAELAARKSGPNCCGNPDCKYLHITQELLDAMMEKTAYLERRMCATLVEGAVIPGHTVQAASCAHIAKTIRDLKQGATKRERVTVREACRQRMPLGGVDAEALEHGMTQLETENKNLRTMYDNLELATRLARQAHSDNCVEAGLRLKAEFDKIQKDLHEKDIELRELQKYVADLGCEKPVRSPTYLDDKNYEPCGKCMPCKAVMAGAYIEKQEVSGQKCTECLQVKPDVRSYCHDCFMV